MRILYFAYGSNMAEGVMDRLCPGHRFLGTAQLPGHRLAFTRRSIRTGTGVADAVPAKGHTLWGVLYEIDAAGLAALDDKEGNGWAYQRRQVRVGLGADARRLDAHAYAVIAPEQDEVSPARPYLQGLLDAGRARGLPEAYVAELAARHAVPDR
jgi:gamma-glutamylcyclotransferase (GGCT)/AIG2-like uncharacterized protein YtfP